MKRTNRKSSACELWLMRRSASGQLD